MATDGHNKTYALQALANRYHLNAIYAFGSRCEEIRLQLAGKPFNRDFSGSDLDIGVQPAEKCRLSPKDKVTLAIELEDLFHVPRVDLVLLSEATPFLALDIIRGELIYCSDYDAQAEYELYVLRRAGDLAHFERKRRRHILYGEE
jgi:predicted nucleotidyltransferase